MNGAYRENTSSGSKFVRGGISIKSYEGAPKAAAAACPPSPPDPPKNPPSVTIIDVPINLATGSDKNPKLDLSKSYDIFAGNAYAKSTAGNSYGKLKAAMDELDANDINDVDDDYEKD